MDEEWEPIPAAVLASIGGWDIPDAPGQTPTIPAGLDDLVHDAELRPIGLDTLALLVATTVELLSDQGRSRMLRRLSEYACYVDAVRVTVTAAIAGPAPVGRRAQLDDFAAAEVAVAVARKCSIYTAATRIGFARDLSSRLTATLAAMHHGEVTWSQAIALSDATGQLPVDVARAIEARVLRYVHRQDINLFKASLRRWVAKLDPDFTPKATQARRECVVAHTRTTTAPARSNCVGH